jgi:hypothetical protein
MNGALPPASSETLSFHTSAVLSTNNRGNILLQRTSGHAIEELRNRCGPGERDLLDYFVFAELTSNISYVFVGGNDVDNARWEACTISELQAELALSTIPPYKKLTSANASAENGVSAGGLMTAVQPAANAAPSFRVIMAEGKFHGVRILTTPNRSLREQALYIELKETHRWAA